MLWTRTLVDSKAGDVLEGYQSHPANTNCIVIGVSGGYQEPLLPIQLQVYRGPGR
jgi:hypothetical protein